MVPYSVYLFSTLIQGSAIKKNTGIIIATAIMLYGSIQLNNWITATLVKEENKIYHLENSSLMLDLWGMSAELEQNLIPESLAKELVEPLTVEQIKKMYIPYAPTMLSLEYIKWSIWKESFPDKTFKKDFIRLILQYPEAYLKIRGRMLSYLLGIKKPIICPYEVTVFDHYLTKGLEFHHPKAINAAARLANWFLTKTPLYLVWVYFVLIFLQLFLIHYYKERLGENYRRYLFVLLLGVIYWLPYLVIAPASDFRFSNLTVYCSILMLPMLLQQILSPQEDRFLST